jgi:ElaB/YqjD/DUF883 family membrane-anchored ribosome-binding protein
MTLADRGLAFPTDGCNAQLEKQKSTKGYRNMSDDSFSDTASSKLESGKQHARQAAEDLRAAAEAKAQHLRTSAETKAQKFRETAEAKAQEWRSRAEDAYGDARVRVRSLREDGEQYVRENPTQAICIALGAGFLLGLIVRR